MPSARSTVMRKMEGTVMITPIFIFILGCTEHQASPAEVNSPLVEAPTSLATQEQYSASHILIGYAGARGAISTRTKEAARSLAKEVWTRVKAGENFPGLAREYSEGPSGSRGGKLGLVTVSNLSPQFANALVALRVGEVAVVTETEFGFHIIQRDAVSIKQNE